MRAENITAAYTALRASIQERYKGQSQEEEQRLLSIVDKILDTIAITAGCEGKGIFADDKKGTKHIELIAGTLYSPLKWEEPAELTDDERKLYDMLHRYENEIYNEQAKNGANYVECPKTTISGQ